MSEKEKAIVYGSINIKCLNGLDIEARYQVGNNNGGLAIAGTLQRTLEEACDYYGKLVLKRPSVAKDLEELKVIAEANAWNWDDTRINAAKQKLGNE